jgi:hypothetical protein
MKPHQPTASPHTEPGGASLAVDALLEPLAQVHPARSSLRPARQEAAKQFPPYAPQPASMDSTVIDELTKRLPTAELVKIIKGALECGKRNLPFTESDLLRTMAFGTNTPYTRAATDRGGAATRR